MNGRSYDALMPPVAPTPDQRTCLMVGSLGVACASCELVRAGECDVRKAGALIAELDRLNVEKSFDDLIPDFRTIKGMWDVIRTNDELSRLLVDRKVGAELIDVRGVHAGNETWGRGAGDRLLLDSAERLVMRGPLVLPGHPKRRKTNLPDFGFRGAKADELGVLRTGLNLGELKTLVSRTSDVFSPDRGIQDSVANGIPLVASVSYAHSSELNLPSTATPIEVFNGVIQLLTDRHEPLKVSQYDEIWRRVCATFPPDNVPPARPRDPRLIIEAYWERCCPDFYEQAQERFSQR